jgi:hypothetical protein
MDDVKNALDALSVGMIMMAFADWLPHFGALVSIVYTLFRIYETKTVQSWIRKGKKNG